MGKAGLAAVYDWLGTSFDLSGAQPPGLRMPSRHVGCVRWTIGAGRVKPIIKIRIDMMSLDEPHQVHSVSAASKAAIGS